jgi:cellulase/cellobiase CelA1
MALKFQAAHADNISMDEKKDLTRRYTVIQWIGVVIAILGFAYNGVKDYQKGEIKLPALQQKQELTKTNHPIQYCLMAYDPNLDKVFYQHENGQWYDFPPEQRKYSSTPLKR